MPSYNTGTLSIQVQGRTPEEVGNAVRDALRGYMPTEGIALVQVHAYIQTHSFDPSPERVYVYPSSGMTLNVSGQYDAPPPPKRKVWVMPAKPSMWDILRAED